jgi:hypothetical protein
LLKTNLDSAEVKILVVKAQDIPQRLRRLQEKGEQGWNSPGPFS